MNALADYPVIWPSRIFNICSYIQRLDVVNNMQKKDPCELRSDLHSKKRMAADFREDKQVPAKTGIV